MVDQDPPHRFRRGREQVSLVPELLLAHQPQIGLVNERGSVQGVSGLLRGHPRGREFPQLVIDERKQVGRRPAVAGHSGVYEVGDLGHNNRVYGMHRDPKTVPRGRAASG